MYSKEDINKIGRQITKQQLVYRKAIYSNLKESGKEHKVCRSNGKDMRIFTYDNDGLLNIVVNSIRFNKENEHIEIHVTEENHKKTDKWYNIVFLPFDDYKRICDMIKW